MLTSKGALSAGQVVRGTTGVDSVYNLDGTKAYTLNNISGARREDYAYDALGRVTEVKSGTNQSTPGIVVGVFVYDAMGRLTSQTDWASTSVVAYSRTVTYNSKGQVTQDDVSAWQGGALYRSLSDYSYGTGASYALGAALQIATQRWKNGAASEPDTLTLNTYAWWDGAVQMTSSFDADAAYTANTPWLSTYGYTVIGGQAQLSSVSIQDGRPRTVSFATDMLGQVIRRDEQDNLSGGDPHEVWYRFSGRQIGYVGNNGSIDTDYASSITSRTASQGTGAFFNGSWKLRISISSPTRSILTTRRNLAGRTWRRLALTLVLALSLGVREQAGGSHAAFEPPSFRASVSGRTSGRVRGARRAGSHHPRWPDLHRCRRSAGRGAAHQ